MKRKYFFVLGATLLLLTACGPRRYGCNKKRCISMAPAGQVTQAFAPTRNA